MDNLEWCTNSQNHIHASKNGLNKLHLHRVAYSGEENGRALLTKEQVLEIKEKYNSLEKKLDDNVEELIRVNNNNQFMLNMIFVLLCFFHIVNLNSI
jgi:hypothetical protein